MTPLQFEIFSHTHTHNNIRKLRVTRATVNGVHPIQPARLFGSSGLLAVSRVVRIYEITRSAPIFVIACIILGSILAIHVFKGILSRSFGELLPIHCVLTRYTDRIPSKAVVIFSPPLPKSLVTRGALSLEFSEGPIHAPIFAGPRL